MEEAMLTIPLELPAMRARYLRKLFIATIVLLIFMGGATAGSMDGYEIVLDLLEGWLSGGLGKTIALVALIGAVAFCIGKQSVMPGLIFVGTVGFLAGGSGLIAVVFTGTV